ncbi:Mitogen-activated protein kinase kinase kinase YODA, partial [Leucoagaricus sp. SymC.cos]
IAQVFIKELTIWAHLSHPNILPFYGAFATDDNWSPISPWMARGNLSQYLSKHADSPRSRLTIDVVSGLQYLHDANIIHGDLKGTNILVSQNGRAIITEFGKSNATTATAAGFTNLEGFTGHECPPELLREVFNENIIEPSKAGDIWSLACLIYEILSRRLAYFQYGGRLHELTDALKRREIPQRPDGSESDFHPIAHEIWYLLKKCWNFNPNERPQCKAILGSFQAFYPQYQPAGEDGHEICTAKMNHQVDFYQVRNLLNQIATQGIPEPAHPSLIYNT